MYIPRELKYLEVKRAILEAIGRLSPGAPIPPERDIAVVHEASRTTVRKAVTELVAEGRLVRRQGSGTYVAEPKLVWPLTISGLAAQAAAGGMSVRTRLLSTERQAATGELAERLAIRPGGHVLGIESLCYVDDAPVAIERAYVRARRYPGLAAAVVRTGSVGEALRSDFGVSVAKSVGTIETAPADQHDAALLHTGAGAPMLLVSRHGHTAEGEPVEWVKTYCRGDRASFVTQITGPPPEDR